MELAVERPAGSGTWEVIRLRSRTFGFVTLGCFWRLRASGLRTLSFVHKAETLERFRGLGVFKGLLVSLVSVLGFKV